MQAKAITPILNVSDIRASFAWFEKFGWKKGFEWGDPPGFGAVCAGECEIFLCENGQGGRGKSDFNMTAGPDGDDGADKGVWMTTEPWNVREIHVRHPDGHVFRVSKGLEEV